jgi:hypothetical protein
MPLVTLNIAPRRANCACPASLLWMPGGFMWGLAKETRTPIGIDLFANPPLTDANVTVFARVRQGKSFLLKLIAHRFLATYGAGTPAGADGRGARCVVVDAEAKQEYRPLCDDVGGQYIRLGPGSPVRINPFDLPPFDPADDDLRDPVRDHIVSLERLLELLLAERSRSLSAEEIAILDLALAATYAGHWEDEPGGAWRGSYTHDPRTQRPERAPLMRDLRGFCATRNITCRPSTSSWSRVWPHDRHRRRRLRPQPGGLSSRAHRAPDCVAGALGRSLRKGQSFQELGGGVMQQSLPQQQSSRHC